MLPRRYRIMDLLARNRKESLNTLNQVRDCVTKVQETVTQDRRGFRPKTALTLPIMALVSKNRAPTSSGRGVEPPLVAGLGGKYHYRNASAVRIEYEHSTLTAHCWTWFA